MGQTKDRRRVYGTIGRRNGPVYSIKAFSLGIAIHCTASRIGLEQTWVGRSLWLDSCDGTEYVSILTSLLKRELGSCTNARRSSLHRHHICYDRRLLASTILVRCASCIFLRKLASDHSRAGSQLRGHGHWQALRLCMPRALLVKTLAIRLMTSLSASPKAIV
jgi:hypothetical protein